MAEIDEQVRWNECVCGGNPAYLHHTRVFCLPDPSWRGGTRRNAP